MFVTRLFHLLIKPITKLHVPPLVVRQTEVTAFTRESQKTLMRAVPALDPGKTVVLNSIVKIPIDDLLYG